MPQDLWTPGRRTRWRERAPAARSATRTATMIMKIPDRTAPRPTFLAIHAPPERRRCRITARFTCHAERGRGKAGVVPPFALQDSHLLRAIADFSFKPLDHCPHIPKTATPLRVANVAGALACLNPCGDRRNHGACAGLFQFLPRGSSGSRAPARNYFFPSTASFRAFATRNLTTRLAGILIASPV